MKHLQRFPLKRPPTPCELSNPLARAARTLASSISNPVFLFPPQLLLLELSDSSTVTAATQQQYARLPSAKAGPVARRAVLCHPGPKRKGKWNYCMPIWKRPGNRSSKRQGKLNRAMRAEDRNGGIFLEHAGMCVLRRAPSPLGFASKDSSLKLLRRFFGSLTTRVDSGLPIFVATTTLQR